MRFSLDLFRVPTAGNLSFSLLGLEHPKPEKKKLTVFSFALIPIQSRKEHGNHPSHLISRPPGLQDAS